jgi:carbon monoxide dehydrogenase subunit G
MDKLLNEFMVNRPIDQTWAVLTDVERIAPCMPGAQLEEIEGDVFRGVVKVKLGAISTAFRGQASFVERDDAGHRAVLKGEGRDTGGKGNADALITATLERVSDSTTKCVVETDLRVTGKVAQFGRGIMADVSKKLMNQFATNLNSMLDAQQSGSAADSTAAAPAASAPSTGAAATSAAASSTPTSSTPTSSATGGTGSDQPSTDTNDAPAPLTADVGATSAPAVAPTVRKIEGPAAEPIELSGVAGTAILKRVLPAIGGLAIVLLVLRRLRK